MIGCNDYEKVVRAEFLGGLEGIDRIRFYYNELGENLEVKNVQFDNIKGSAIAPTTFNHLLVEGCTFTDVEGRIAYIAEGGQNVTFGKGVLGGTIRDINDSGMNINWTFATYYVSGFGRIFNNNCKNINVKHIPQDKVFQKLPEYRIKNCTIAGDSFSSQLEYIEYVNCTFTNFNGDVGVLRGCKLNEEAHIGDDVIIYSK